MPALVLTHLEFRYSDSVPLLRDVSFHLSAGWTGMVGPNGAGKTTLLRLLAGDLEPEGGQIRLEPRGAPRVLCSQRIDEQHPEIASFAESLTARAQRLRGQLLLEAQQLRRWSTLSPGERKRWQIGAALSASPGLLLLDEPTNHLDFVARDLLLRALRDFDAVGVVVSHDRSLLNALCHDTVRVRFGEARLWSGAYDVARRSWGQAERHKRLEHARARKEERKLRSRLSETRNRRDHADAMRRTSKRMKGRKDSSTRGAFKATRRRSAEARLGREVGKLHRQLAKAEQRSGSYRFDKRLGGSLSVRWEPAPARHLMAVDLPELRAGGKRLLGKTVLEIRRESRIWLRGPNGAGKTTLLEALVATAKIPPERMLYLRQELGPPQERALLEGVRALEPDVRGRVLGLAATLGIDPEPLLVSRSPSPGEGRKLAIADGLGRQVWVLILDEPTNHLDLESIEALEDALAEYPGALVLVTHDEALARRCTETTWDLVDETVEVHATEPRL